MVILLCVFLLLTGQVLLQIAWCGGHIFVIELHRLSSSEAVYMAASSLQPTIKSKVKPMINWWHLLWIVPAAALAGLITEALLIISKDDDK